MAVDPRQIIIGAGTEYLYTILIQLLGIDKTVAFEEPSYSKIGKIYQQFHIDFFVIYIFPNDSKNTIDRVRFLL